MPGQWLFSILVITAALHVIVVLLAARAGWDRVGHAEQATGAGENRPGDEVTCPACEERNEPGYRYCGHCVAELPSPSPYTDHRTTFQRRETI